MIAYFLIVTLFVSVTGACIGSFLNVVALRALSGESIVFPASKCPKCNTPIKWYDNIPVLSYLLTFRGKCRSCGEKVSVQYPVVEAFTALMFLFVFICFGISLQSFLLLVILCISEVIVITDIKEGVVFDFHSMSLIILSVIYSLLLHGFENFSFVIIGLIAASVIMETVARGSYFLIKKKNTSLSSTVNENDSDDEDLSIEDYVEKNKRAFGEGDTMLAAASGALLGWKYFILVLFGAVILQTVCIFPQFLKNLFVRKEKRLLFSLCSFFLISSIYFLLSNLFELNLYVIVSFILILVAFALDSLKRLKNFQSEAETSFTPVPFGPALLVTTFIFLFFGKNIALWVIKHIFFFAG